ncbi:MATE family efflux transporter [Chengkuizengella axinellae]|uniref:MATE family efflux transporter n=1 Tax=Chengkuizengella axinellae TaxID=3064388 RepID=A0ABT9ITN9_9BACL|nr:MATE family efflux transporter [Chengkuizengella sp. 2205SS18-9]MDP5272682.1 MATE family efflux transporter [Chengkuizengella sp. 2205SS18-9]
METNLNWKKIISFSLPMTLIGIADLLLIGIDFFWIYYFIGEPEALSALRVSSSIILLIEAVLVGVISALLVYISQHNGAGHIDKVMRGVKGTFSFSIYAGIMTTFIGLLLLPVFIMMFGVSQKVSIFVGDYLSVYLVGYIAISLNNLLLLLPRYFQKLNLVYKGLSLTLLTNLIITPIFMLVFTRFGMNAISGAATGTVVANLVCSIYMIWQLFLKDHLQIGLSKKQLSLKVDFQLLKQNISYIGSQIFNGLTYNVSMFLYILILSYYPEDAFNVYAVASYIFVFFGVFAQNFAASIIPMVSEYIGSKQINAVKDLVKKMVLILLGYCSIVALIVLLSKNQISMALSTNDMLTPLFANFFTFYTIPWIMNTIAIVFIFVVAGAGDSKGGVILTITNMYVIVLVCLLFVPQLFQDKTNGVFITLALIEIFTFVSSFAYYLYGRWTKATLVKENEVHREEGLSVENSV